MRGFGIGGAALLAAFGPFGAKAADIEHGKALYQGCVACHADSRDALGPSLKGVFGRKSGALENYRYSPAMARANLVWDEVNLKAYIANPQTKVKGSRMPFGGISDPKGLDDVVAFLKVLK